MLRYRRHLLQKNAEGMGPSATGDPGDPSSASVQDLYQKIPRRVDHESRLQYHRYRIQIAKRSVELELNPKLTRARARAELETDRVFVKEARRLLALRKGDMRVPIVAWGNGSFSNTTRGFAAFGLKRMQRTIVEQLGIPLLLIPEGFTSCYCPGCQHRLGQEWAQAPQHSPESRGFQPVRVAAAEPAAAGATAGSASGYDEMGDACKGTPFHTYIFFCSSSFGTID
jgi:hypothetical protein